MAVAPEAKGQADVNHVAIPEAKMQKEVPPQKIKDGVPPAKEVLRAPKEAKKELSFKQNPPLPPPKSPLNIELPKKFAEPCSLNSVPHSHPQSTRNAIK